MMLHLLHSPEKASCHHSRQQQGMHLVLRIYDLYEVFRLAVGTTPTLPLVTTSCQATIICQGLFHP